VLGEEEFEELKPVNDNDDDDCVLCARKEWKAVSNNALVKIKIIKNICKRSIVFMALREREKEEIWRYAQYEMSTNAEGKKSKAFDWNSTRSYVLVFYILRIHDINNGNGCAHVTLFVCRVICAVDERNRWRRMKWVKNRIAAREGRRIRKPRRSAV